MTASQSSMPADLPPVAPVECVDRLLHGELWQDHYGWMRDQSDPRLLDYLRAERQYYERQMAPLRPLSTALNTTARAIAAGTTPPQVAWRLGAHKYFTSPAAAGSFPKECRRRLGTGNVEVVLDHAELADGQEFYRLGLYEPSPGGCYVAYSVDHVGNEVFELRVRDTRTGLDVVVHTHTYYTAAWSSDSTSLFYVVHDEAFRPYQVWRHLVDERRSVLVWQETDPRFFVEVNATRNREWVVISTRSRDTTEDRVIPAADPATPPRVLAERRPGVEYFTEHWGDAFVVLTNDGGPDYRVMSVPPGTNLDHGRELVASDPGVRVHRIDPFTDHLLLHCYHDGRTLLRIRGRDGSVHDIEPDRPEGMIQFEGRPRPGALYEDRRTSADSEELIVTTQSLVDRPRRYTVSLRTGERKPLSPEHYRGHYDSSRYSTVRLVATGHDGVEIPITLAHRADLGPGTTRACLVTCYGSYERPRAPLFSPSVIPLLDRGLCFAIAHVRGGGELGRRWWLAARLISKSNSVADAVSVRDHLVDSGWSAPDGVVLRAECAGGIIAGAAYTFTPERWAAVVAEVPAVDLLNSMLDPTVPLTPNEWDEFGDPRDIDVYRAMRCYVAYENLIDQPRPPLLVTTNLHDPRVLAHKPAKWVAALRRIDTHGNQILLRAVTGDGGHHGPSAPEGLVDYTSEIHSFVLGAVSHLL